MTLQHLLAYAAPYRYSLAGSASLLLVDTAVTLAIPWLGGQLAQRVATGGILNVNGFFIALLALLALQASLKFGSNFLMGHTSARILADLRVRVYDHLQSLPLAYFHRHRQGEIIALMTHETEHLAGFIAGTLTAIGPSLLSVAGAVFLMFRIDPLLAALIALLVPLFYLTTKVLGRRLRPLSLQLREEEALAVAIADENLTMLPAIKTFTREGQESDRYARQIEAARQSSTQQLQVLGTLEPALHFLASAGAVLILWLISERVGSGQMNAAELVSFLLYAALLTRPIGRLAGTYGQALMARVTLQRLQSVLTERPEPLHVATQELPPVRGDIEFLDIGFAYPGRPAAVKNLNLRIAAGETLAITGENGAGKSTLANLLIRLHEPQQGRIFIDGVDISAVSLHSLRGQVGIVPQHVLLFNGTVRDNIAYGRAGAHPHEIEEAARVAQAHNFIGALPQGYDTQIGDHGIRLSGGQRQRIALARALLKNPPILVLDEATAMFDPAGERLLVEACRESFRQRTVILITHRPASLALADRVVRLEHGSVQELG